jgi:hypothetical protein
MGEFRRDVSSRVLADDGSKAAATARMHGSPAPTNQIVLPELKQAEFGIPENPRRVMVADTALVTAAPGQS